MSSSASDGVLGAAGKSPFAVPWISGSGGRARPYWLGVHRDVWARLLQAALIGVSIAGAAMLRFDFAVPSAIWPSLWRWAGALAAAKLASFELFEIHRVSWRSVGLHDAIAFGAANACGSALAALLHVAATGTRISFSILVLDGLVCQFLSLGVRIAVRGWHEFAARRLGCAGRRVLIYGAGRAGLALLREIRGGELRRDVVGFIDDDPLKARSLIQMAPVLGSGNDLARLVQRHAIDEVLVAIPSAGPAALRRIIGLARAAGVCCKTIPALADLLTGRVRLFELKDVDAEDLLGRPAVRLDERDLGRKITGRAVMVTGAGGSIGSELCRQIARWRPEVIVALDRAENYLFAIDGEMRSLFPRTRFLPCLGDVLDNARVGELIRLHQVQSIFHAAAYKHVPMVEGSVFEAVVNNAIGAWRLAEIASQTGVEDFVLISSDKAVRPTNMMGATKRLAELFVRAHQEESTVPGGCRFVAVRFGNVLGSNGSVVPLFKQQIAAGGPVTVTDPEMYRYFMTIPEAAQLVLQAFAMGKGGEIFVLKMGEPVRILDLAYSLIELSGFEPEKDITVVFSGPRPGEKLREELNTEGERVLPTNHEKIQVFAGPKCDYAHMAALAGALAEDCRARDLAALLEHIRSAVPEYAPSPEIFRRLDEEPADGRHTAESLDRLAGALAAAGEAARRGRERSPGAPSATPA